jgi:hypothetical protein
MHTNYRRKRGQHNPKREGQGWSMTLVEWRPFKRENARRLRARAKSLVVRGRFDDILNVDRKSIRYDYW